jgi:hypothetical protein
MWTFYNRVQAHSPDSGDKSRPTGEAGALMPPIRSKRASSPKV